MRNSSGISAISFFFIFVLIPSIALITSMKIQSDFSSEIKSAFVEALKDNNDYSKEEQATIIQNLTLNKICSTQNLIQEFEFESLCNHYNNLEKIKKLAISTIAVSILAILIVWFCGYIGRLNRKLLLFLFISAIIIIQLTIVFLVIANAILLTTTIYYAESYWLGKIHIILIGLIAVTSFIIAISIAMGLFSIFKKLEIYQVAKIIKPNEYPLLFDFINNLSLNLSTTPPDNIIVGFDLNFFVTEANIKCLDGKMKGKTLYISLPLLHILTIDETKAIIAHELGHYIGEDTKYSRFFYPIYKSAANSLQILNASNINQENGLQYLAILPSQALISYFLYSFNVAESKLSRGRELRADNIGARSTSNDIMATALLKAHIYSQLSINVNKLMLENLNEDKYFENLTDVYNELAEMLKKQNVGSDLLSKNIEHPTDSHPPLSTRLNNLGANLNTITTSFKETKQSATTAFDNFSDIEKTLTQIFYRILIESNKTQSAA